MDIVATKTGDIIATVEIVNTPIPSQTVYMREREPGVYANISPVVFDPTTTPLVITALGVSIANAEVMARLAATVRLEVGNTLIVETGSIVVHTQTLR